MKPLTERLIQLAMIVLLVASAWYIAKETLITMIQLERGKVIAEQRAVLAEQQVQQLQSQAAKVAPVAPAPKPGG